MALYCLLYALNLKNSEPFLFEPSIANAGGNSAFACGLGSLGGELGDPIATEKCCAMIKGLSGGVGIQSMMTVFNMEMLEQRMAQDYRWIMT